MYYFCFVRIAAHSLKPYSNKLKLNKKKPCHLKYDFFFLQWLLLWHYSFRNKITVTFSPEVHVLHPPTVPCCLSVRSCDYSGVHWPGSRAEEPSHAACSAAGTLCQPHCCLCTGRERSCHQVGVRCNSFTCNGTRGSGSCVRTEIFLFNITHWLHVVRTNPL